MDKKPKKEKTKNDYDKNLKQFVFFFAGVYV